MKKIISILMILSFATFISADINIGAQAGISSDPDQIFGGLRADIGTLLPGFNLVAVGDLGIGSDFTSLSVVGDLQYKFYLGGTVTPYVGVGVGYFWNVAGGGDGLGLSVPIGIKFAGSYFIEARIGFEDSPDLKICLGIFL